MRRYGLIGFPLGHSFSKQFFEKKFLVEGITDARYDLFPMADIRQLPHLLAEHPDLCGLNVTIPHKQSVLRYLYDLDPTALAVGAVNTVRIRNGRLKGYNTDVTGFEKSLLSWAPFMAKMPGPGLNQHSFSLLDGPPVECMPAVVLGTGGAARAVGHVLEKWGVNVKFVSRTRKTEGGMSYNELNARTASNFTLLVNATPVGTYPDENACPPIPYDLLNERHLVYDLVYNPAETLLLQRARARGASVKNGLEMLQLQAEAAWDIWQT
ncbi:MAG: shikimate dehydrogenase family protein [Saprospiraceae bacterium]